MLEKVGDFQKCSEILLQHLTFRGQWENSTEVYDHASQ